MKKFASLLLTALMLAAMLSVFAVPASAEGEEVKKPEKATWFENNDDPVWWELTESKTVLPDGKTGLTLTVGGKGKMPGFHATAAALDKRPWKNDVKAITTVIIESGVTKIGSSAFYGCTNLTSVTIPSSATSIESSAFYGCESLTSVVIPYGVTSIDGYAFQGCKSLQSVTIPSSVTSIVNGAFKNCESLQSVTIPSGVTEIYNNAFQGCKSLQSVTIPYGVTSIGQSAFMNCASLQSVTIPYGVASIGLSAFMNCASLQSVTIPSSVTRIEGSAFQGCDQLASVTVKTSTPPTLGSKVFNNTPGNLAIYVPCGAGTAYQEATNWSGKSGQIKEAYIVDDQPGKNGTITFDKDTFPKETYTEPNETVTVTVMPAEGYQLQADSLLVTYKDENGEEMTADLTQDETDPMKYTFTMPCSNVTVSAAFEEITDETETGSTLSDGNVWIIAAVAVVAIGGVAALVIVKKKKKPALADGE